MSNDANEISAIEAIGSALNYDAVEIALIHGSLSDALRVACTIADLADEAPVSIEIDADARGSMATVAPRRAA